MHSSLTRFAAECGHGQAAFARVPSYNLILVESQRCFKGRKVTVGSGGFRGRGGGEDVGRPPPPLSKFMETPLNMGLASHWPCVTDFVVYKKEMSSYRWVTEQSAYSTLLCDPPYTFMQVSIMFWCRIESCVANVLNGIILWCSNLSAISCRPVLFTSVTLCLVLLPKCKMAFRTMMAVLSKLANVFVWRDILCKFNIRNTVWIVTA